MNAIVQVGADVIHALETAAGVFAGSIFEGADGSFVWEFLFVTLILGGLAARATGRANAGTWRPYTLTFVYILLLGLAVRFLHFALFQRTLLSPHYYIIDEIVLQVIALWSYRATRAGQMTRQYRWMFQKSGSTGWIRRTE
jgi:hypothetical protein